MLSLATTTLGDHGPRIAFLHGLFGQGKNWRTIAKALSDEFQCTMVDLPNHGASEWTDEFSYIDMADAVSDALAEISDEPWIVLGHSMGGKAAMLMALRHPEQVSRLIVVDISPVDYHGLTSFAQYAAGMKALDLDALSSRGEADEIAQEWAPETAVRSFLLQNLRRTGEGWRWAPNLDVIEASMPKLGGWPADQLVDDAEFRGPVLWIAGGESNYVKPEYRETMNHYFPNVRLATIKGAGHWPHSQFPDVFLATVRPFVEAQRRADA